MRHGRGAGNRNAVYFAQLESFLDSRFMDMVCISATSLNVLERGAPAQGLPDGVKPFSVSRWLWQLCGGVLDRRGTGILAKACARSAVCALKC